MITYGKFNIDFSALPVKAQDALISRGITHYLGNEQASKVSAWVKGLEEPEGAAKVTDDEKTAKKAEFMEAAFAALLDGTIGTRTGGPKADPLTRATRDIAGEEVKAVLKAGGHKVPAGTATLTIKGEALTFAQMVERRIASEKHGERIAKAAKARVAASAKPTEGEELDDL